MEQGEREALARQKMAELQRMAERIYVLILDTDYPWIDVEIEKGKVRERCEELFPGRVDLYEMVYESRFQRLWEQWRQEGEGTTDGPGDTDWEAQGYT